ncbi:amidohydrolase family protein [Hyphococcus flavus]|uniref:Amidohydrolase family protein n=1 Tax=Hyphococcus flavus TaxID=1866326 RepID=A0AAE9ZBE4_9PROT|nr:amidohydrolase family protein [Hyphococcus flavus]WDI30946.1 amidohydrolase family protein [Hyphococcus flavus]
MRIFLSVVALVVGLCAQAFAQEVSDRSLGEGPYDRLVIRGATVIDGAGAPPVGPIDIVVEGGRITGIVPVGSPGLPINSERRPAPGDREIDASGMYLLPGFVSLHAHIHDETTGQGVSPEYIFKLWLAHGITTVRDLGNQGGAKWTADLAQRSARNEIDAPNIYPFPVFRGWSAGEVDTPAQARARIRKLKSDGAYGVKFFGAPEEILWAGIEEAKKQGLKSTMHHAQLDVAHADVLDTSARGLDSMEHWYGLPEALFDDQTLQDYPLDYNYNDEQHRFENAGKLWAQAAKPGSEHWNYVMDTLLEREFSISPTFSIYMASRDWMRSRRAEWHDEYTMPSLWNFFKPDRNAHGSYWFDWGTEQEVAWRENYHLWMQFINEYKNRGGKVGVGEDAGYIYSTYGFGYVSELEMFREAGFHPLEVINAATLQGAKILGVEDRVGSIQVGKQADMILIKENPLANMKALYATGHIKLDPETNKPVRVGGVDYVVKNGLVYSGEELRSSIKADVAAEKERLGIPSGPMPIVGFELPEE